MDERPAIGSLVQNFPQIAVLIHDLAFYCISHCSNLNLTRSFAPEFVDSAARWHARNLASRRAAEPLPPNRAWHAVQCGNFTFISRFSSPPVCHNNMAKTKGLRQSTNKPCKTLDTFLKYLFLCLEDAGLGRIWLEHLGILKVIL